MSKLFVLLVWLWVAPQCLIVCMYVCVFSFSLFFFVGVGGDGEKNLKSMSNDFVRTGLTI